MAKKIFLPKKIRENPEVIERFRESKRAKKREPCPQCGEPCLVFHGKQVGKVCYNCGYVKKNNSRIPI